LSLLRLVDPLGERPLQPGDLPLTIGGPGSAIVLPGLQPGELLATLGTSDGRLFVEPAPDAALRLDGVKLGAAGWLDDGSVLDLGAGLIRIESQDGVRSIVVEHEAVGNVTLPPLLEGSRSSRPRLVATASRSRSCPTSRRAAGLRPAAAGHRGSAWRPSLPARSSSARWPCSSPRWP
jgi:hypothetical protein